MNKEEILSIWDEVKEFILSQSKDRPAQIALVNKLDEVYRPKFIKAIENRNEQ